MNTKDRKNEIIFTKGNKDFINNKSEKDTILKILSWFNYIYLFDATITKCLFKNKITCNY